MVEQMGNRSDREPVKGGQLKQLLTELRATQPPPSEAKTAGAQETGPNPNAEREKAVSFNGRQAEISISWAQKGETDNGAASYLSLAGDAKGLKAMGKAFQFGAMSNGKELVVVRPRAQIGPYSSEASKPMDYIKDFDKTAVWIKEVSEKEGGRDGDTIEPQKFAEEFGDAYVSFFAPQNEEALKKAEAGQPSNKFSDSEAGLFSRKIKDLPVETAFKYRSQVISTPSIINAQIERSLTGFGEAALKAGDVLPALEAFRRLDRIEDQALLETIKSRLEILSKSDKPEDIAERLAIESAIESI